MLHPLHGAFNRHGKRSMGGKIGPFGRNQTWIYEGPAKKANLTPSIPAKK